MVALQSIEDERLVCLWDFEITETASIGKIKLSDRSLHTESRQLRVHLNIDTLVGLDANNELIAGDVLEDTAGDVLELDSYFGLLLVQSYLKGVYQWGFVNSTLQGVLINTFTSLQDEWNTVPSLVLDIDSQSTESWTSAILRNSVIIQIPRLATIKRFPVLANDDILGLNSRNSPKNPDL